MSIILVGLNHKTAPVEIREKVSFSEGALQESYGNLLADPLIQGCVIISTCNRTEIYAHVSSEPELGIEYIRGFLKQKSEVDLTLIKKYTYTHIQNKAIQHLFKVAAGLDSMLLGETQILGQVKTAYQLAYKHKATNKVINNLFKQAVTVGKRVRTETCIDQHAVSISYAAVEMAKQLFGSLTRKSVLVIGAGKMSELTAKHLVSNGVSGVIVSNRSFERAVCLASEFKGKAVKFNELYDYLGSADIVISCTAATHYVVKKEQVQNVLAENPGKKIMMIDIAVPRDIEPDIGKLSGVSLYDIDALQNVVDNNLMERKRAAVQAEAIIAKSVEEFAHWLGSQYVIPTVAALKKLGSEIKQKELERAFHRLGELSDHDQKVIKAMANSIVNQLLHAPVTNLKEYALTDKGPLFNETLDTLFHLDKVRETGINSKPIQNDQVPVQAYVRG